MTLMTDDIEWYPLPEVDDSLVEVDATSSCKTLSTAASHSSTAISLSYLTPASSVTSCRSQHHSDNHRPHHLTGTIQPYLKRNRSDKDHVQKRTLTQKHGCSGTVDSSQSQDSVSTNFSTTSTAAESTGRPAGSLLIPRQVSSTVSFKTAESQSLKCKQSLPSNFQATPSLSVSADSVTTTASLQSVNAPADDGAQAADNAAAESFNTKCSQTSPNAIAQNSASTPSTVNGSTVALTHTTYSAPQDCVTRSTSPASSEIHSRHSQTAQTETAMAHTQANTAAVPASSYLPSQVLATRVQLGGQQATISLAELDKLWTVFLASSLGGGGGGGSSTGLTASPQYTVPHSWQVPRLLRNEMPSSETRDTGIQTTPSLVAHDQRSFHQLGVAQQMPHLSQLTLQESLRMLRPDFVRRSEQRQRKLRSHHELRSHIHCRESAAARPRWRQPSQHVTESGGGKTPRAPHFILIDVAKNRPKMSPLEMYHNSKKYWCKLPEVQQKVWEQRRESEAATNRLRMKLYQQEVLGRLRQKK